MDITKNNGPKIELSGNHILFQACSLSFYHRQCITFKSFQIRLAKAKVF